MGWLVGEGLLTPKQARQVYAASRALCKELGAVALPLVDGFGIPEHMLTAPIAKVCARMSQDVEIVSMPAVLLDHNKKNPGVVCVYVRGYF